MSEIVHGLANDEYHRNPALGSSTLKRMAQSPFHAFKLCIDPDRPASVPTPAMSAGTLAHCAILEPETLSTRYTVRPAGIDGRTKYGKEWILDHTRLGCELVTEEQMHTAMRQAAAIRALPEVAAIFDDGHAEISAFATDAETGVEMKARPDWTSPAGGGVILLDLKTCADASPEGFAKAVANFAYPIQQVHYCDVYEAATGVEVQAFVFAAVENAYPYAAAVYCIPEEWRVVAERERRRLIALYAECKASGHWPGFADTVQLLPMPRWLAL